MTLIKEGRKWIPLKEFNPARRDSGDIFPKECSSCKNLHEALRIRKGAIIWTDGFTIKAKENIVLCKECSKSFDYHLGGSWKNFGFKKFFKRVS